MPGTAMNGDDRLPLAQDVQCLALGMFGIADRLRHEQQARDFRWPGRLGGFAHRSHDIRCWRGLLGRRMVGSNPCRGGCS